MAQHPEDDMSAQLAMPRAIGHSLPALDRDLEAYALFLDLDGTLIDIASRPDAVSIPAGLAEVLERLSAQLGGALAIISGRSVADVDRFLAPLKLAVAGLHGAELRGAPSGAITRRAAPIDAALVAAVQELERMDSGLMVEPKGSAISVHYRLAPGMEERVEQELCAILANGADHLILSRGRKVFEIVPRHVSKGTALAHLLSEPPFAGRSPIMIGDDVSDQPALEAAVSLGGSGLRVAGEHFTREDADFAGPAQVRAWLAVMAKGGSR